MVIGNPFLPYRLLWIPLTLYTPGPQQHVSDENSRRASACHVCVTFQFDSVHEIVEIAWRYEYRQMNNRGGC